MMEMSSVADVTGARVVSVEKGKQKTLVYCDHRKKDSRKTLVRDQTSDSCFVHIKEAASARVVSTEKGKLKTLV